MCTDEHDECGIILCVVLQAANTSTSDDSDVKKSEFTLAGNKSKQMKNMMTKWSSFKDDEDS